MSTPKVVVLQSSDGERFEIEEAVAALSQTIKPLIKDDCETSIPVPDFTSKILAKVIEYCKRHADAAAKIAADGALTATDDDLKAFDAEFVKVDPSTLLDLILAAEYLKINSLLDLTCQTVADMIKGKTPEEVRLAFDLENDFTPDEEAKIRRENAWAANYLNVKSLLDLTCQTVVDMIVGERLRRKFERCSISRAILP